MNPYIQSITIKQVRHLRDLTIEISPENEPGMKHLILTGRNGSGKTSLLNALRDYLSGIPSNQLQHIEQWRSHIATWESRSSEIEAKLPLSDEQTKIQLSNEKLQLTGSINQFRQMLANYEALDIRIPYLSQTISGYNDGSLILVFFAAKRANAASVTNTIQSVSFQDKYSLADSAATLFVQYLVSLKARRSFAKDANDLAEAQKIDSWFERILRALRDLFDDQELELLFDSEKFNFKIQLSDGHEPFDFNSMSDGYSSVLNIVSELIMRMEKKSSQIYDLSGIVLIDEIETHLHIDLQKKILPFLTSFFPKVQFIVTSHSPFVLNSIPDAVIYDLEKRIRVEDLSGYSADGIVKGYFLTDEYSQELKGRVERYKELAAKPTANDDEQDELEGLDDYFRNLPIFYAPELQTAIRQIRLSRGERA